MDDSSNSSHANCRPDPRRQENERDAAARMRKAIVEGFHDILAGRYVEYRGNLRELLDRADESDSGDCRRPDCW